MPNKNRGTAKQIATPNAKKNRIVTFNEGDTARIEAYHAELVPITVAVQRHVAAALHNFASCTWGITAEQIASEIISHGVKTCLEDYEILLGTVADTQKAIYTVIPR